MSKGIKEARGADVALVDLQAGHFLLLSVDIYVKSKTQLGEISTLERVKV